MWQSSPQYKVSMLLKPQVYGTLFNSLIEVCNRIRSTVVNKRRTQANADFKLLFVIKVTL